MICYNTDKRPPRPHNSLKIMISTLSTGLGLAGCLYGAALTLCGAIGLASPCPWSTAAQCEALQQKASAVTQNGAIVLVVGAAAAVSGIRRETV